MEQNLNAYRVAANCLNQLTFETVKTTGLRIELACRGAMIVAGRKPKLSKVRVLQGYTPWYFALPDPAEAIAWKQLMDPRGFYAPFGLTTAERRSPDFCISYTGHKCQWNGPSWPYATSVTLTALANLLNGPGQAFITKTDYFKILSNYALSQRRKLKDGTVVPWIDEDLNPFTGDWISRTMLLKRHSRPLERGKDYNHSTFCDVIITGLVGLRPRSDDVVEVNPLAPGSWNYFCLDQIRYHGHGLTILWDKTGRRYHHGKGLRVFCDGHQIASSKTLQRVTGRLYEARK